MTLREPSRCTCQPPKFEGHKESRFRFPWSSHLAGRQIFGIVGLALMLVGARFHMGPLSQPEQYRFAIERLWNAFQSRHDGTMTVPTGWTPIIRTTGTPMTWGCGEIKVIVNAKMAPVGALADLKVALAQLSTASGDSWVYSGTTKEQPSQTRSASDPVLVAWVRGGTKYPNGAEMISDYEAGRSGPVASNDGRHWVSGTVVLNADRNSDYVPGFGVGRTRGALMLHELGHVVGLGHVGDTSEIMTTYSTVRVQPAAYSSVEVRGLRTIFKGCTTVSKRR